MNNHWFIILVQTNCSLWHSNAYHFYLNKHHFYLNRNWLTKPCSNSKTCSIQTKYCINIQTDIILNQTDIWTTTLLFKCISLLFERQYHYHMLFEHLRLECTRTIFVLIIQTNLTLIRAYIWTNSILVRIHITYIQIDITYVWNIYDLSIRTHHSYWNVNSFNIQTTYYSFECLSIHLNVT